MEQEDEALKTLQNVMVELLKNISYVGEVVKKKSTNFLAKINSAGHSDVDNLEKVGLGIVSVLKKANENIIATANNLEENLEYINKDRNEKLFTELSSKLLEFHKTAIFVENPKTECLRTVRECSVQTDLINESSNDNNIQPKSKCTEMDSMREVKDENVSETAPVDVHNNRVSKEGESKRGILSLRKKPERTDTQDTDDGWTDSLAKNISSIELWNRESHGEKINLTDEYLDQLKKEQEEKDECDKQMVDVNAENKDSSKDDVFVDGHTPEDGKDICKELDVSPKEETLIIEEHKISDLDIYTAPNSITSKDIVDKEDSSIMDKSDCQPKKVITKKDSTDPCSNKEASLLKPGYVDYNIPGCSKNYIAECHIQQAGEQIQETIKPNDSNFIETDKSERSSCSQSTEVVCDLDVLTKLDLPENAYISPYSVETVKLGSDSDESPNSPSSVQSEYNKLTQVTLSNEVVNTCTEKPNTVSPSISSVNEEKNKHTESSLHFDKENFSESNLAVPESPLLESGIEIPKVVPSSDTIDNSSKVKEDNTENHKSADVHVEPKNDLGENKGNSIIENENMYSIHQKSLASQTESKLSHEDDKKGNKGIPIEEISIPSNTPSAGNDKIENKVDTIKNEQAKINLGARESERYSSSSEKESVASDKPVCENSEMHVGSPEARTDTNKHTDKSSSHTDKSVIQVDGVNDKNTTESDSDKSITPESSEADKLFSDIDENLLTELMDCAENKDHCPPDNNLVQPLIQDAISSGNEEMRQGIEQTVKDSEMEDNGERECFEKRREIENSETSEISELNTNNIVSNNIITESSEKSLVVSNMKENKTSALETAESLSQTSTHISDCDIPPHNLSGELVEASLDDTTKNEELKSASDQTCDPPEYDSAEKLSVDEPNINTNDVVSIKSNDEEDNCSSQSFEFDIGARLNKIDDIEDIDIKKEFSSECEDKNKVSDGKDDQPEDAEQALKVLLAQENEDTQEKGNVSTITTPEKLEDKQGLPIVIEPGVIKETIEIVSDSDDDVHLDVTMEEIISSGSSLTVECVSDDEVIEKTQEIQEIEPIPLNMVGEENVTECNRQGEVIADELLELLREVEVPSNTNCTTDKKDKFSEAIDVKKADEIFRMLQEQSYSDISDLDMSDNISLSSSDLEWFENCGKTKNIEDKKLIEMENAQLVEFYIKDCYVPLERLEINEYEVVKVNEKLNYSIDRLCDISSLLKKRKYSTALGSQKYRSERNKRSKQGTSNHNSESEFSDFTDSETEKNIRTIDSSFPELPVPQQQKVDVLLANEICNVYKNNTSDESTNNESDGSDKNKEKKRKKDKHEEGKHSDSDKKEKLSKEELRKKAWKNDPLLRGKLDSSESDSSSTSNSEKSRRRKKFFKTRYEHDTDFHVVSDSSDSDSDGSIKRKKNKVLLEEKIISPIKKNIPISDSDSTDSEIEFVPQQKSPKKNGSEEEGINNSQKGRRNIRALMSDESLAEATQRANKEEQERIERLEDRHKIKESFSQSISQREEVDSLILDVDVNTGEPLITVHQGLNKILKPHQREGIQFMWDSCYESVDRLQDEGSGCILAHCMGLGKTFQVLALIHTLFAHEITNTRHVLVVCPLSTVNNWKKEVKIIFKDFPEEKFNVLTIADKKETGNKYDIVKKWSLKKKCVLVLGYEGFETLTNEFKLDKGGRNLRERMLEALVDPGPDLVICDEGHLLRNKKALKTMALNRIRTKRRIVLTGTPLQNNLLEYYHMVQFVKPNLLGNMKEFKTNFVNPITNGQYEDSTKDDIKLMMKRTHVLHKLLKKSIQRVEDTELKIYLPKIVDYAIFIQLHQIQVDMYNKFSELVQKNSTDTNRKGFLSDFVVFQYIGTHPYLLSIIDEMKNKKIKERDLITNEQEDNPMCNIDGWWKAKMPVDAAEKIEYGNKLMVVKSILEECEEIGDKVLLFSQSLGELDLIEHFLKKVGTTKCSSWQKKVDYFRMDGTVSPEYRSIICDLFNSPDNQKIRLLLMSTKVGGLGLNLTAANRVIIMTVNWNPSLDTQSVFRVYRFGQQKEVFVYRLISLDTMEEKVYQRTVTKLAIAHRVVDKHQITRHYKSMDLQELYSCTPKSDGERTMPNLPEDQLLGKLILNWPFIFKYHEHQALLANRPEDNLNEQELNAAWDEFKRIKDAAKIPPPQLMPQITNPNGPTFNEAYALNRPAQEDTQERFLQHYYIPKSNTSLLPSLPDSVPQVNHNKLNKKTNNSNPIRVPKIPTDTVIMVVDNPKNCDVTTIPLSSNKTSNVQQDPLYIPHGTKHNTTYNEMLKRLPDYKELPKLPKSTMVMLENKVGKNNQKENLILRVSKPSNTGIDKPVTIEDDNESIMRMPKLSLLETNVPSTSQQIKRKYSELLENDKERLIKKMKRHFNSLNASISLDDDDDDVTVITDTTPDSGLISGEIAKNFGLTEITIHKIAKDSNNSIITLD